MNVAPVRITLLVGFFRVMHYREQRVDCRVAGFDESATDDVEADIRRPVEATEVVADTGHEGGVGQCGVGSAICVQRAAQFPCEVGCGADVATSGGEFQSVGFRHGKEQCSETCG